MTLRHLRIFITVADKGSMTAAAKALFVAQPTVSQAVSELEEYYGVKLFDRLSRKLYITVPGMKLLSYARHIIELFQEMDQAVKSPELSGKMRIGASVTIGTSLLPQLVREYQLWKPEAQIEVVIKNTREIEEMLMKNTLDFALVEGAIHCSDLTAAPFMEDELVLVCGKSHPLFQKKRIQPQELSQLCFILREEGSGTRELFESTMAADQISWKAGWECSCSDAMISAAKNGMGVAVISKRLVKEELACEELSSFEIKGIGFSRKFNVIHHKNKYLTDAMNEFMTLCTKESL